MLIKFYSLAFSDDVSPVWTASMDAVPRVGENVVLPQTMAAHRVHDVTYVVAENTALVIVEV